MKHPKFNYHLWNMIRRFMTKPYANKNFYAHMLAWHYFEFKEYWRIDYETS